jgi:hypothetical protein
VSELVFLIHLRVAMLRAMLAYAHLEEARRLLGGRVNPMESEDYMGPGSDFGWRRCHGCESVFDDRDGGEHEPGCPKVCLRDNCEWHAWVAEQKSK